MKKQKIPQYLRVAIYMGYNRKSGYDNVPLRISEMEIDHIIPERVVLNPKELDELEKWREKYDLEQDFNIQGIENLIPSDREFNLFKSDKGLYDEGNSCDNLIRKALMKAKHSRGGNLNSTKNIIIGDSYKNSNQVFIGKS